MKFLFIGIGGAIGALLRYVVSGIGSRYSDGVFPAGTLAVNLIGCFIIGLLWSIFEEYAVSSSLRVFIFIGILGGFTTFSTFALENFNLLRDGEKALVFLNIVLSIVCGLFLVFAGYMVAKMFLQYIK